MTTTAATDPDVLVVAGADGETLCEYINDRSRVCVIRGPLGSGKTDASCQRVFMQMCEMPVQSADRLTRKSRWFAVRNTYPDLTGTTIKDWMALFGDVGKINMGNPPTWSCDFALEDDTLVQAELVFLALDRPDDVRKLRGAQATGFWLNELKELDKANVDMADLRHGRYPGEGSTVKPYWHGMIADTNSPDDSHWLYKLAEETKPEGWRFLAQPGGVIAGLDGKWAPNPKAENLGNLPGGSDYYMRGCQGKSDDWIKVNLANQYGHVSDGKPVYGQWRDDVHLSKYPLAAIKGRPLLLGFDWGLTPACVVAQLMPSGQLRLLREIIAERAGVRPFIKQAVIPFLKSEFPGHKIKGIEGWGDPSGVAKDNSEDSAFSIAIELGLEQLEPAPTNDPEVRQEAVRHFLTERLDNGQPALLVDPRMTTVVRGFRGGYRFRRIQVSGEARYTEKPDKNSFSHSADAVQYVAVGVRNQAPPAQKGDAQPGAAGHIPMSFTAGY